MDPTRATEEVQRVLAKLARIKREPATGYPRHRVITMFSAARLLERALLAGLNDDDLGDEADGFASVKLVAAVVRGTADETSRRRIEWGADYNSVLYRLNAVAEGMRIPENTGRLLPGKPPSHPINAADERINAWVNALKHRDRWTPRHAQPLYRRRKKGEKITKTTRRANPPEIADAVIVLKHLVGRSLPRRRSAEGR